MHRIEFREQACLGAGGQGVVEFQRSGQSRPDAIGEGCEFAAGPLAQGVALGGPEAPHAVELKTETPLPLVCERERVGGAQRPAVGGHPEVERPAGALTGRLDKPLAEPVEVGPLQPVDLDIHGRVVEERRHRRIGKDLAIHARRPEAGGIPNRNKDRPP